jgi:hypothetical protein
MCENVKHITAAVKLLWGKHSGTTGTIILEAGKNVNCM